MTVSTKTVGSMMAQIVLGSTKEDCPHLVHDDETSAMWDELKADIDKTVA